MVSLALPMITLKSSRALKPDSAYALDAYSSSLFLGIPEDRNQAPLGCIGHCGTMSTQPSSQSSRPPRRAPLRQLQRDLAAILQTRCSRPTRPVLAPLRQSCASACRTTGSPYYRAGSVEATCLAEAATRPMTVDTLFPAAKAGLS